jgi:hypothetical protein
MDAEAFTVSCANMRKSTNHGILLRRVTLKSKHRRRCPCQDYRTQRPVGESPMPKQYIRKGTWGRNQWTDLRDREPIKVVGPSIAYIPLTQGKFALVDAEMVNALAAYSWNASERLPGLWYARTAHRSGKSVKYIQMHVIVLPPRKGFICDHRNHDGLDNRLCNLRLATRSQNRFNSRRNKNNTTGFKGVQFAKDGRFSAHIKYNYKTIYLGAYKTPEEAHATYCAAAKEIYGAFYCEG